MEKKTSETRRQQQKRTHFISDARNCIQHFSTINSFSRLFFFIVDILFAVAFTCIGVQCGTHLNDGSPTNETIPEKTKISNRNEKEERKITQMVMYFCARECSLHDNVSASISFEQPARAPKSDRKTVRQ